MVGAAGIISVAFEDAQYFIAAKYLTRAGVSVGIHQLAMIAIYAV
jgi:hypothetical protein